MQQNAANVYATMQKDGLTGRALEAQVLSRAAGLLRDCQARWGENGQEERLDAAIRFNQKVWTFFQAELSDPENPMPVKLKENILSLSIFIDRRLIEVLLGPAPELLDAVININQNIAAGLMQKQNAETSGTVTEPTRVAFSV